MGVSSGTQYAVYTGTGLCALIWIRPDSGIFLLSYVAIDYATCCYNEAMCTHR